MPKTRAWYIPYRSTTVVVVGAHSHRESQLPCLSSEHEPYTTHPTASDIPESAHLRSSGRYASRSVLKLKKLRPCSCIPSCLSKQYSVLGTLEYVLCLSTLSPNRTGCDRDAVQMNPRKNSSLSRIISINWIGGTETGVVLCVQQALLRCLQVFTFERVEACEVDATRTQNQKIRKKCGVIANSENQPRL